MARPYYSKIARAWHEATGSTGGPFKKYVLNDLLLSKIGAIDGARVLELGAGNGYFARLLIRRRSGQVPARLVVTDICGALLRLAEAELRVRQAEYRQMDVRRAFPFEDDSFDLVIATMVLNELKTSELRFALCECRRVLREDARLLATVVHPDFVSRLDKNQRLSRLGRTFWTMPASGTMRVPVVRRSGEEYERLLTGAGFRFESDTVFPSARVINERPGLRHSKGLPLALLYACRKA